MIPLLFLFYAALLSLHLWLVWNFYTWLVAQGLPWPVAVLACVVVSSVVSAFGKGK